MSLSPAGRPADPGGFGGAGSPPRQPEFVNEFTMSLSPAGRPADPGGVRGGREPPPSLIQNFLKMLLLQQHQHPAFRPTFFSYYY